MIYILIYILIGILNYTNYHEILTKAAEEHNDKYPPRILQRILFFTKTILVISWPILIIHNLIIMISKN